MCIKCTALVGCVVVPHCSSTTQWPNTFENSKDTLYAWASKCECPNHVPNVMISSICILMNFYSVLIHFEYAMLT